MSVKLCGNDVAVLVKLCGNDVAVSVKLCGNDVAVLVKLCGNDVAVSVKLCGNDVAVLVKEYWLWLGSQIAVSTTRYQTFYRYLPQVLRRVFIA